MVRVKISKNVLYSVQLDSMKVTMSVSHFGIRLSVKEDKNRYTQTMDWQSIHDTFTKMIEDASKESEDKAQMRQ